MNDETTASQTFLVQRGVLVMRLTFCAALLAATLALGQERAVTLRPAAAFAISGHDAFRLSGFAAAGRQLYFVLTDTSGIIDVVRTTEDGEETSTVEIPVAGAGPKLVVDADGNMIFLMNTSVGQQVIVIDSATNQVAQRFTTPFNLEDIAVCGKNVIGISVNALVRFPAQGAVSLPQSVSSPFYATCLPNNRLAILELVTAHLLLLNPDGTGFRQVAIISPEVQGIERPQIEGGWVALVHAIGSDASGNIYVGVTGHKRQDGVPVLRLDASGALNQRFNCILPTFGRDPNDHRSYIFPSAMAVSGNSLFWASRSEKRVARYDLPN